MNQPHSVVPTVVIAGAGFSGAVTAAQLLRCARSPLRVLLVNRTGRIARGLAYGTRSEQHLLNVPAGRMSAYADDEDHFLRYVQAIDPAVNSGTFVSRQLYGEYLESLLEDAAQAAVAHVQLERVTDEITDVEVKQDALMLALGGGATICADHLVLAIGNYAPANPSIADPAFFASSRYVRDPWRVGALEVVAPERPVLLIGTGLTMLDIALDLRARGRSAPIHAISRRGLLPVSHRAATVPPTFQHRPPDIESGPASARAYVRSVRRHVRRGADAGLDWREVMAGLRPITPSLWQRLDEGERARFLRHLRVYWDVHRHRAAPRQAALLQRMIREGELQTYAARLIALADTNGGVTATIRRRGAVSTDQWLVGAVINCTGPQSDLRRTEDPLMRALCARGFAVPDTLGLGLRIADDNALYDVAGQPSRFLYHVGPLLKARDWEATAVPELRVHAARVAGAILASLGRRH